MGPFESTKRQGKVTQKYLLRNRNCKIVSDIDGSVLVVVGAAPGSLRLLTYVEVWMAAPITQITTADHVEAIGMRVLRIAEDMAAGSRYQGRTKGLIEQAEQAAIDLRVAVRGNIR